MSKVEEFLMKYNPEGVDNIPLWELTAWDKKFNAVDKSMQKKVIKYKYYLAKDLDALVDDTGDIRILYTNEKVAYTSEEKCKGNICEGEIVAIPWGGTPTVKYYNGKFVTGDNRIATSLDTKILNNKYLFYWMISQLGTIADFYRGAGIQHPSMISVLSMQIPLPHIKVQEEIVKILDSFTNLIDALNEELSLRQKQFEYYREKLLTFDESNYVKISSICKRIVSGGTPKTTIDRYYQGNIPWLRTEEVDFCYVYETKKHISEEAIANSSTKMIPVNCVIIAMYGATAAKCCINKIPLCTNQACCNLEIDDTLALYKFVFYNICKEYEKLKSLGEGSQNNISGQKIKDYRIPIPSLAIQQSIVEKLDAFESLISSLKEEIALRQKQYEYYREKLLTFD